MMKVEENLADLHRFQLHRYEAKKYYHKALNTLSNIAAVESDDIYKQLVENKGQFYRVCFKIGADLWWLKGMGKIF